ncbi:DUF1801 domain-containing protein [Salimicrobium flavidum]|uniref:YdhG-like domain-containing protein n=1 Tax=Salimicrobium flavidum TaxID=570947 RepID=A0A1N7J6T1_9BACI|nr:DUF1801 domain-containing protein [Salimicrobium flavidum]SIS44951.1 protein of unknown function (DU1801) [Salimicrobium flavidum]
MKIEAGTIEELFEASGQFEEDLRKLDEWIMETEPHVKRQLISGTSITMMGYGEMDWQNDNDGDYWPVIGVAPQKNNLSVYVSGKKDGKPLLEVYTKEVLGGVNNGKHCIRIRNLKKVDEGKMKEAIRDAFAWAAEQRERFEKKRTSTDE